jgi:hypothetical protein
MMTFDEQEVQLLVLALRFWRTQRRDGVMRRTDPVISPQTIEVLLAKLEASRLRRPLRLRDDPGDPFGEFFSR